MINQIGQIMLYVNNQDQAKAFWSEKAGFHIKSEEDNGHMRWVEIAPTAEAETRMILHDKELIAKMSPELNLGTPSIMFFSDRFDELYDKLSSSGVTVGEIVQMGPQRVFNFADDEDNYFAVMDHKQ